MKKLRSILVLVLVLACCTACFASCGEMHFDANGDGICDFCKKNLNKKECSEHVDENVDGICDNCEEEIEPEEGNSGTSCTNHTDSDGDGKCDSCGSDMQAEAAEYTVKFDLNMDDLTIQLLPIRDKKIARGEAIAQPTVSIISENPDNWQIIGWYLDADCTDGNEWDFDIDTVNRDITLYAKWISTPVYVVTYYAGYDYSTLAKVHEAGVETGLLASKCDNKVKGHEVLGYYTDKNFTTEYDFTAPVTGNLDIYIKISEYLYVSAEEISNFTGYNAVATLSSDKSTVSVLYTLADNYVHSKDLDIAMNGYEWIELVYKAPEGSRIDVYWVGKDSSGNYIDGQSDYNARTETVGLTSFGCTFETDDEGFTHMKFQITKTRRHPDYYSGSDTMATIEDLATIVALRFDLDGDQGTDGVSVEYKYMKAYGEQKQLNKVIYTDGENVLGVESLLAGKSPAGIDAPIGYKYEFYSDAEMSVAYDITAVPTGDITVYVKKVEYNVTITYAGDVSESLSVPNGSTFKLLPVQEDKVMVYYSDAAMTKPLHVQSVVSGDITVYVDVVDIPLDANGHISMNGSDINTLFTEHGGNTVKVVKKEVNSDGNFYLQGTADAYVMIYATNHALSGDDAIVITYRGVLSGIYSVDASFTWNSLADYTTTYELSDSWKAAVIDLKAAGIDETFTGLRFSASNVITVKSIVSSAMPSLITVSYAGDYTATEQVLSGTVINGVTVEGRSVLGYYTDAAFTTEFDTSTPITEAVTVYVKLSAVIQNYTVTYSGDYTGTETVTENAKIKGVSISYREVYYYTDKDCTVAFDPETRITANTNLYVKASDYLYIDAEDLAAFTGHNAVATLSSDKSTVSVLYTLADNYVHKKGLNIAMNGYEWIELVYKAPAGSRIDVYWVGMDSDGNYIDGQSDYNNRTETVGLTSFGCTFETDDEGFTHMKFRITKTRRHQDYYTGADHMPIIEDLATIVALRFDLDGDQGTDGVAVEYKYIRSYALAEYTVTYAGDYTGSETVTEGGTITGVSKTGHSVSYYADAACTVPFSATASITADTTVYVKFTANDYTVTYAGDISSTETVKYGQAAAGVAKEGHTPAYYTDAAFSAAYDITSAVTGDITVYVKYTVNNYTVTYAGDASSIETVAYGDKIAGVTREGYTAAYYTDADHSESFSLSTAITGDITLYVVFTEIPPAEYTVTYAGDSEGTEVVTAGATISGITVTGYTVGYYTDSACTEEFAIATPITANITIYVKLTLIKYTVSYSAGDYSKTETVEYGKCASGIGEISGYTVEYFSDSSYATAYSFDTAVTSDMTIYVKLTKIVYTVTYSGDYTGSETVALNDTIEGVSISYREALYYTDAACTEAFDPATPITGAITLYVKASDYLYIDAEDLAAFTGNNAVATLSSDKSTVSVLYTLADNFIHNKTLNLAMNDYEWVELVYKAPAGSRIDIFWIGMDSDGNYIDGKSDYNTRTETVGLTSFGCTFETDDEGFTHMKFRITKTRRHQDYYTGTDHMPIIEDFATLVGLRLDLDGDQGTDGVTVEYKYFRTYAPAEYTVTYAGDITATETVIEGGTISGIIKDGYSVSYYTDDAFTTAFDATTKITADTTVYVKLTEVAFDPATMNGGLYLTGADFASNTYDSTLGTTSTVSGTELFVTNIGQDGSHFRIKKASLAIDVEETYTFTVRIKLDAALIKEVELFTSVVLSDDNTWTEKSVTIASENFGTADADGYYTLTFDFSYRGTEPIVQITMLRMDVRANSETTTTATLAYIISNKSES